MIIREATFNDMSSVAELFAQYRVFYEMSLDIEGATKFLTERLENDQSVIFVAENDAKILTAFIQLYPLFSSTRLRRVWLLNDLFVHEEFRRLGISKLLLERAKDLCRQTGACEITLETSKSNQFANKLYFNAGFQVNEKANYYSWAMEES
ncbi:MAG: GNAT family N-acetyltransferase [Cyclobacteriaceae bacterium]